MTNPKPRAALSRFSANTWWFLLGLALFGAFGFAMFFAGAAVAGVAGTIGVAALMTAVTGGAAVWAIRSNKIALGSGLLIGYAVAAVASGGQCVFMMTGSNNYGFLNGAAIYVYGTALMLAVAVVTSLLSLIAQGRGSGQ
jgi:hypothetical protein